MHLIAGGIIIKTFFTTLSKHNIQYKRLLIYYFMASLIISASHIIVQIFIGEMGQATYQFDSDVIIQFLILLTAVMGVRAIFSALNALLLGRFAGKAGYMFRVNFAKFFLHQPFAKLEKTNSGENLSVFANDLPQAVQLVSSGILRIIGDFTLLIVAMVYMFYMNWFYTLIFVAMFPILTIIQGLISTPIQKSARKVQDTLATLNAVVNDSLQNVATIIAYNLEEELENHYVVAYKKYFDAKLHRISLIATIQIGGGVISLTPLIYLFIISAFAVVNETMLISEFLAYTGIGMMAGIWLVNLAQSLSGIRVLAAGADKLNDSITGEIDVASNKTKLTTSGKLAVSFENINFAYAEDSPDVLKDVSFEIPYGAKVAFIGGSGSGKSTILKLLLGLYEPKPNGGKINVLGNDITNIDKYSLREAFAYVPQDSFLFPVSILENITGCKEVLDTKKLEKACRDAGILDFINSLPDKFDSILSESAENISGGQRQRIAMARAFYKDAPIILFDEATSALDPTTEAEILKSLEKATKDKTVIMVAHRASAKAFCDTIITMEGGKIV